MRSSVTKEASRQIILLMHFVLLCLLTATHGCDPSTTLEFLVDPEWNVTHTECPDSHYPSVDEALSAGANLSSLTIVLAWKSPPVIFDWFDLSAVPNIVFQGNQQTLRLNGPVGYIVNMPLHTYLNLTLDSQVTEPIILVGSGRLIFDHVKCVGSFGSWTLSPFSSPELVIRNSEIENTRGWMFPRWIAGISLEITDSVFRNITGGVISIEMQKIYQFDADWTWKLTNSQFLGGSESTLLMQSFSSSPALHSRSITIMNCTWIGLAEAPLKLLAETAMVTVDSCSFRANQAGIQITIGAYQFFISNSAFFANNGAALNITVRDSSSVPSGTQLVLIDHAVFQNNGQGVLITSAQSGALVNITRSQFLQNGNPSINGGCVSISFVLVSLSNLHFENCVGNLGPAIYLDYTSHYAISDVEVWNTVGRDGVGLYVNAGDGLISQFSLYHLVSSGNILITQSGASTKIVSLFIQNCTAGTQILFAHENVWSITGLILANSNAKNMLMNYIGSSEEFVIRDSVFYNSIAESVHFHSGYSTMKFINCTFDFPNRSEMILFMNSGLLVGLYKCIITGNFHAIFSGLAASLQFELIDSLVTNSVIDGLFDGNYYISNVRNSVINNVTIVKSSSVSLFQVNFNLVNVTVTGMSGNIMILTKSVLVMDMVYLREFETYGTDQMLVGSETNLTIINSSLINFHGFIANSMLQLSESSIFHCINSSFSNLTQTQENGLNAITGSNVILSNVIFDNWNVTLFDAELSGLWLTNCTLTRGGSGSTLSNSAKYNGGLINGLHVTTVWMQNTVVMNVGANNGGVLYLLYNKPTLPIFTNVNEFCTFVVIINSTFANTAAITDGGAFHITEGSATISNSTFSNGQAEQDGGFFSLICNPHVTHYLCKYTISDTQLIDSLAGRNGGAIYYNRVKPKMMNVSSRNTTAIYGPFIAGYPIRIGFLNSTTFQEVSPYANTESSGIEIEKPLYFGLFDHQDILVSTNSLSQFTIKTNLSAVSLSGQVEVKAIRGVFVIDSVTVISVPGSMPTFSLTSDAIDYLNVDPNTDSLSTLTTLSLIIRNCTQGEIVKEQQCYQCAKGSYSYNTTDTLCKQCKPGMTCNGGTNINININYWRDAEDSDEVFECYVSGVCVGDSHCAEGYTGRLCSVCAQNWFRLGKHKCVQCWNLGVSIVLGVFIILAVIFYLAYLIYSGLRNVQDKKKSELSVQLKIVLNFVQVMMLMNNFQVVWPDVLNRYFDVLYTSGNSAQMAFSTECYSSEDTFKYLYQKLIVMTILPAFMILTSVCGWGIVCIYKRDRKYVTQHCINTICVLLLTIHPMIMQASARMFSCRTMENSTFWLIADLTIKCWEGDHSKYLLTMILPDFIIWCLGIPLTFFILLVRSRKRLREFAVARRFAFLYSGYQPNTYYWEFVIMIRKSYFVLISNFLSSVSTDVEASIGLFGILAFTHIQDLKHPFFSAKLNEMESISLMVTLLTLVSGILYNTTLSGNEVTYYVMVSLVLAANANLLVRFLLSIYQKVGVVFVSKWPRLRKCFCLPREVAYIPSVASADFPDSQFHTRTIEESLHFSAICPSH